MFPTAALEDIEDVINPQVPVTNEELETVVKDVQSDDAECAAIETDIERFETVAVTMESLLQKSLPMVHKASEADVRHLTTAVCAVASSSRFSVGPSLAFEAIDDQTPEQKGSRIISKIKEYALRLWSMLTDAFERVVDWFTQFLQKVTGAAGKLRRRSEDILKKNQDVTNQLKEGAQKSLTGRVASVLGVVEGTPQDAVKNLSNLVSGLVEAGRAKYLEHLYTAIEKLAKDEDAEAEIEQLVSAVQKTYNPLFEYEAPGYEAAGGKTIEIGCSEVLPGNYHGYMSIPKDSVGLGYFRYDLSNSMGSLTTDQGLPVLSHAEIDTVLKHVVDIAKTYENVGAIEQELKRIKQELVKTRGVIEKAVSKEHTEAINPEKTEVEKFRSAFRVQVLRGVLSFVPRVTAGIHQKTMSFALSRCQSITYWAEWSRSQYAVKTA